MAIQPDKSKVCRYVRRLHAKQYEYAMRPLDEGGLGLTPLLDALGIPYCAHGKQNSPRIPAANERPPTDE